MAKRNVGTTTAGAKRMPELIKYGVCLAGVGVCTNLQASVVDFTLRLELAQYH